MSPDRKRVLIATTSFPNSLNPPAGVFVAHLAIALQRYMDVVVLAPSANRAALKDLSSSGVAVEGFRYAPRALELLAQRPGGIPSALRESRWLAFIVPMFLLGFMIAVARKMKTVDCVQANWLVSGMAALLPVYLWRKQLILTLHGEDARKIQSSTVHALIFKLVAGYATRVICVGEDMQRQLCASYPGVAEKMLFLSNGVEDDLFDRQRIARSPGERIKLLVVASLVPIKSIEHVIEVLSQLKCRGLSVELTVIGGGPLKESLSALASRLNVASEAMFAGVLSQAEVYDSYFTHDIFVIASQGEGRSSVVMEAMAAGMPVVGANVPGVKELLAAGGCFPFEHGNRNELSGILVNLISEGNHLELGLQNRHWMEKRNLRWSATAKKYAKVCGNED